MALSATPLGIRLIRSTNPLVVVRLYNCLTCPFSARGTLAMVDTVAPALATAFPDQVEVRMFLTPQPWHPQSGLLAEVVLATQQVAGEDKAKDLIVKMYRERDRLIDETIVDLSRFAIYDVAATMAEEVGVDKAAVLALLELQPKGGTKVTAPLKRYVKHHRTFSIHVTPTAVVNDLIANDVSSSWGADEWRDFLAPLVEEAKTLSETEAAGGGGE